MAVDLLSVGQSGLFAAKKSLSTTGHNISNVNTEGFSRQKVHQSNNTPIASGGLIQGSGVRVDNIKRVHDEQIEKRLSTNISDKDFHEEALNKLSQVEEIFNETNGDGIQKLLSKLFNSFRDLANHPEDETIRSVVRENARLAAFDLRRVSGQLDAIEEQIGTNIKSSVQEINTNLDTIAGLNKRIRSIEVVGGETGDLRDQRDRAVRTLSEYFKVQTYEDNKGDYIVNLSGVGSLVSGGHVQELQAAGISADKSSSGRDGTMEIFFKEKPSFAISKRIRSGTIAGLLKTRNQNIQGLREKMDALAYNLGHSINAIHNRGFANKVYKTDQNGEAVLGSASGPATGIDFFKVQSTVAGAAKNIDISENIKEDLRNIATALAPNKPGDNRVALAMSKLQHEKIIDNGTKTLEEHYLEAIGDIGIATGKAAIDLEQSEGTLAQTQAIRDRISGVSLDEEAANLVKYQHAYQASAKVMSTAQQTFNAIMDMIK